MTERSRVTASVLARTPGCRSSARPFESLDGCRQYASYVVRQSGQAAIAKVDEGFPRIHGRVVASR
jgi:hypothetical protein